MIRNYLKTAYRNLLRNKVYAVINISGLALGITCCLVIFLIVKFELSFDNFHSKGESIYRITSELYRDGGTRHAPFTTFALPKAMRNDYPEIETVTQTYYNYGGSFRLPNNDSFSAEHVYFADHEFLNVFDFELLEGDKSTALFDPNTIVLTKSFAQTLYGNKPPVGEILELNDALTLKVTGVVADPPENSHQPFTVLVSYKSFTNDYYELDSDINDWDITDNGSTYVLMPPELDIRTFEAGLESFGKKYKGDRFPEFQKYLLQPLSEIHFDTRYEQNFGTTTSKNTIMGFAGIGIILLLAACINFINLSTAQSVTRAKEVGIRKVMGAFKQQLIYQFLSEVLILCTIASIIAIGLTELSLPFINELINTNLNLNLLTDHPIQLFIGGLIISLTFLAGLYPSFILSRFQPATVLRNKMGSSKGNVSLRRFLVVTQFMIAQVLIIATIVVFNQIDFFNNKPLGFETDYVVNFGIGQVDSTKKVFFKTQLLKNPDILHMSIFSSQPSQNMHLNGRFKLYNIDPEARHRTFYRSVDADYIETYNLELLAGRDIDDEIGKVTPGVIVNESLIKKYGITDPNQAVGEAIEASWGVGKSRIVGVIKDFHNRSLQNEITPMLLFYNPNYHWRGAMRLSGNNVSRSLDYISETYSQIFPGNTFDYQFENERLAELYSQEENTFSAFQMFALIAIAICCLGLFGLVSFVANQKIKEVGIRKALGANVGHILMLFSQQFSKPLVIAFALAAPIGYLVMNEWLSDFAYKIDISMWTFVITGIATICVAGFTVGFHSFKSAKANPVDSLRCE